MFAQLEILTGSLAGQKFSVTQSAVTVGRDKTVDLQFDPLADRAVSGRHASLSWKRRRWWVTDLGSLNGTLVNGVRIAEPTPLRDGDRVQLGAEGPTIVIRSPGKRPPGVGRDQGSTRRVPTRLAGGLLLVAFLGLAAAFFLWFQGMRQTGQVQALQARIDSILESSAATADDLLGRNEALHQALSQSRTKLQTVQRNLAAAEARGDPRQVEELRVQLQEAQAALVRHQLAAAIDTDAIEAENGRALAKVFVDLGYESSSATAFSVRSDGTLLTNRHVVAGPSGTDSPVRLAVQFADSRQVWPARVVAISEDADLAALRVENIRGDVPTISGFNSQPDTIPAGQGVAVIGFPMADVDRSPDGGVAAARTTVTAGILERVTREGLEVSGYGVEGSSGSPVFDATGAVVGVLFGVSEENGIRTLHSVSAHRVLAFLARIN